MRAARHKPLSLALSSRTLATDANTPFPLKGEIERMARRRFQDPKPFRRGQWWCLLVWEDEYENGLTVRRRKWHKLAKATLPSREVQKIAAELLRPMNQGLETIGGATNFAKYVDEHYIPVAMKSMASSTRNRYEGVIENYLKPAFGNLSLRDLTPMRLDEYFAGLADKDLAQESLDKVRDVLASILKRAIRHGLLVKNPTEGLQLPRAKVRRPRSKPYISPQQFDSLILKIPEPYATMVHVAVYTGLRVSELAALKWNDIRESSISIDERFCRGDWGEPKSEASCATIAVNREVIERIHRLKLLTVEVRAGRALRKYKVVKAGGPEDLVFQGVKAGKPMRDNNVLVRFIKPAARELGIGFVNWRCLRTSHATWLKLAGADVKDAQAQMRHSRASTTLDIYQQFVPESQRAAVDRLTSLPRTKVDQLMLIN